jgi:hypothetical protein
MPLSAGDKLSPYEILTPIEAGGMSDVYKAGTRASTASMPFSPSPYSS